MTSIRACSRARHFLVGPIEDHMANLVVAQLLFLSRKIPTRTSILYQFAGRGGGTGLAIYDTMQFIKPAVSTVCVGQAASMGALLLTGGTRASVLPAARTHVGSPAARRLPEPGHGYRDPRARDPAGARTPQQYNGQTHRSDAAADRAIPTTTTSDGAEAMAFGLLDTVIEARLTRICYILKYNRPAGLRGPLPSMGYRPQRAR